MPLLTGQCAHGAKGGRWHGGGMNTSVDSHVVVWELPDQTFTNDQFAQIIVLGYN
jgi:hypothetical protein